MLEIWRNPPPEALRLAKYVMGPPGAILFLAAIPILWLLPRRAFRPALLAASILLLVVCWGPTFAALLLLLLAAAYPLIRLPRFPAAASFLLIETGYFALFFLPLARLPAYSSPELHRIYPGLFTDRELVFYLGLAFTNLRLFHLALRAREGGEPMSVPRYLLYLLYAPTYRLGPFLGFDDFDRQVERRQARVLREDLLRGLAELLFGVVLFEAIVKMIDAPFFKLFAPDDGSYWYLTFFDRPPDSRLATVVGIYLISIRYYLFIKAYSHVARGMSRMIGIRLPRNMNWPLVSDNLASFWRRYHVTLSEFAQSHILRPLEEKTGRAALAVLGAFVFMSLWHRPALHTLLFAFLQVAGIAVWYGWRILRSRWPPLRALYLAVPQEARQVTGIVLTLNFVVWTVPVLLDIHHGGAVLIGSLWRPR
jgi:D-alanyl-lipoteichoic acid acyltransferase DltB (MBOAT superfamily)